MSLIHLPLPPEPTFQPTAKQRRLLNYIHEHPSFKTVHELCHAAGISRSSYYLWTQDPAFRRWMTSAWSARLLLDGAVLLNIARANAGRSYPYWKALFDLTFDPRGLGALQHWQQSAAAADPDHGLPIQPPDPPPPVRRLPPPSQAHTVENRTNPTGPHFAPSAKCALRSSAPQPSEAGPQTSSPPLSPSAPRPHHHARLIIRAQNHSPARYPRLRS